MMSNHQMLKVMINERLSVASEEIFALFEKAVADYQREIDRLKKATEPKQRQIVLDPDVRLEKALQTDTAGQQGLRQAAVNTDNAGAFHCKEEPEQVMITRRDEPQMLITNVKTLNSGVELQPHGQNANSEWPEEQASGGAETDNSSESAPDSEEEEEDSDANNDGETFGFDAPKKPFICVVCDKLFPHKRSLKKHMRRVHTCEEPLTSAECKSQLQDSAQPSPPPPEKDPAEAGPFSCTGCDRRFRQMYSLEVHMREHAGENLFTCTECNLTFTKEANFSCHMKTVHSVEKPFECSVCNKCLKTNYAHKTHMLIHTGERPFRCSVCGKGFVQKVSLKNHMLTHTGEKPFSCAKCGKRYTSRQSLMIHMRLVHR